MALQGRRGSGQAAVLVVMSALLTGVLAVPDGTSAAPAPEELVAVSVPPADRPAATPVSSKMTTATARDLADSAALEAAELVGTDEVRPDPVELVDDDIFADEVYDEAALGEDFDSDIWTDEAQVAGVSVDRDLPAVVVALDTDVDPTVAAAGALSPSEIFGVARAAGFEPRDAVVFTAIALAESGGRPEAHNGVGEDSWGLWQINLDAHRDWAGVLDLTDPADNAAAAWRVSRGGATTLPWTVTHAWTGRPYLRHLGVALAAGADDGALDFAWLIEEGRWRNHFAGVIDPDGQPVTPARSPRAAPTPTPTSTAVPSVEPSPTPDPVAIEDPPTDDTTAHNAESNRPAPSSPIEPPQITAPNEDSVDEDIFDDDQVAEPTPTAEPEAPIDDDDEQPVEPQPTPMSPTPTPTPEATPMPVHPDGEDASPGEEPPGERVADPQAQPDPPEPTVEPEPVNSPRQPEAEPGDAQPGEQGDDSADPSPTASPNPTPSPAPEPDSGDPPSGEGAEEGGDTEVGSDGLLCDADTGVCEPCPVGDSPSCVPVCTDVELDAPPGGGEFVAVTSNQVGASSEDSQGCVVVCDAETVDAGVGELPALSGFDKEACLLECLEPVAAGTELCWLPVEPEVLISAPLPPSGDPPG